MDFTSTVMGLAFAALVGIPLVVAAVLVRQLIAIAARSRRRNSGTEQVAGLERDE